MEIYGKFIETFIEAMTGSEAGQFRLEIPTFRIILERSRVQRPQLIKFTLTENGKVVNNLDDNDESIAAMSLFLQKVIDFISSLVGEEHARDVIHKNMEEQLKEYAALMKDRDRLLAYIPDPIEDLIRHLKTDDTNSGSHQRVLKRFNSVFSKYLADLSKHTDLSALKLKLSILREKNDLLKHMQLMGNQTLEFETCVWSNATDEEVGSALVNIFDSIVGLSIFMMGKEEAIRKGALLFQEEFHDDMDLLERYGLSDKILDGALHNKLSTGLIPLDRKLQGGLNKGSSILLVSPSGIERDNFLLTLFSLGLSRDGSLLYVTSKEPPRSVRMLLKTRDLNPEELEETGHLRIVDWFSWRGDRIIGVEKDGYALKSSKILSNLGIAINKSMRELDFSTNNMALIHFIGPAINIFDFQQVYNFIQRLRAKFKENGMCAVFLLETESLGKEELPRLMEVFDGTIEIRKNVVNRKVERDISILSMDGIDFDAEPIGFAIKDNRLVPEFEDDPPEKNLGSQKKHIVRKRKIDAKDDKTAPSPEMKTKKPMIAKAKNIDREISGLRSDRSVIPLGSPSGTPVKDKTTAIEKEDDDINESRTHSHIDKEPSEPDFDGSGNPQKSQEAKVVTRRVVRRRRVSSPTGNRVSSRIDSDKESDSSESPDILLKEAVSTIDKILEKTNNLKERETSPIRVKRKMHR
ncbi:MAG: RAD55 family ATPase [Thermoplasmatota archaeon]